MPPLVIDLVQTCVAITLVMAMRGGVAFFPRARRAVRHLNVAATLLAATMPLDGATAVLREVNGARGLRIALLVLSIVVELSALGHVGAATVEVIRALRPPRPPRRRAIGHTVSGGPAMARTG
jgi:hypothetical protein